MASAPVYDIRDRSSALTGPKKSRHRADIKPQQVLDEITDAHSERMNMEADWRSLMNLTMPSRQALNGQSPGQIRNPQEKYASEPVRSMRRGVGNYTGAMVPAGQEWGEIAPGPGVPENRKPSVAKGSEIITKQVFAALEKSRFGSESHTMGFDIMVSMGFMRIALGDRRCPLNIVCVPLQEGYPVVGPSGDIENVHRKYMTRVSFLERDYPSIRLTPALQALKTKTPRAKVECVEATVYDPEERTYRSCVIDPQAKVVMWEGEPEPVSPWITPRLSVTPGNVYGTGFGMDALPAIRVLNKLRDTGKVKIKGDRSRATYFAA